MKFMKYPSLRRGHMSKGLMLLAQMTSALLVLEVANTYFQCSLRYTAGKLFPRRQIFLFAST